MSMARRIMRRAPPPTAMPAMAPVLRMGVEVAVAGELVVDTPDEEVVVEVDVGRELVEVGDAEVALVDAVDDDICRQISIIARLNVKRDGHTEDDFDDGAAVMIAARKVASGSLSVMQENQRSVGELEAIQVCQWQ